MNDPVLQAEQHLARQRAEEHLLTSRRRQSLRSLLANPDFTVAFVDGYLADVTAGFLDQLRTCSVEDLPLARQRWIDSESFMKTLQKSMEDVIKPEPAEDERPGID